MRQVLIIVLAAIFVLVAASAAMAEEAAHAHSSLWGVALLAGVMFLSGLVVAAVFSLAVIKSFKAPLLPQASRLKGLTGVTTLFIGNYSVLVGVYKGKWISPFKSSSGRQIIREDRGKMIESLKGCLEKEEFTAQKEELIRKGIIK